MKKTTGICLFTVLIIACVTAGTVFWWNKVPESEPGRVLPEPSEVQIASETEELLASMQTQKSYRYLLVEENGVLIVYESDGETVLLETNIRLHGLSDETKALLKAGIQVTDEQELYDFLESYSS